VTIGGTVSPAGGNFEEPVTQSTLKVVGAFHGLSRERSDARRYPAIHPLESWSKYEGPVNKLKTDWARQLLFRGNEVNQMMKVVGEEGTSLEDYVLYLKSEFFDSVYLQQNAFDPVDAATSAERQRYVFDVLLKILMIDYELEDNDKARSFINQLRQKFLDWNGIEWKSDNFYKIEKELLALVKEKGVQSEDDIEEKMQKMFV
jgi:V/A-type H+-transporting ATPase subunit A